MTLRREVERRRHWSDDDRRSLRQELENAAVFLVFLGSGMWTMTMALAVVAAAFR